MLKTLTMPKLSPTMESGTIVKWYKKEGEFVSVGETLFDVATDKATVEYQAIDEGWLRQIVVHEGQEGRVNQPVAVFTEEQEESIEGYQPEAQAEEQKIEPAKEAVASVSSTPQPVEPPKVVQQPVSLPQPPLQPPIIDSSAKERIVASPLAKKLAKERGLDLSNLKGSGPSGRIVSRDLEKAAPLAAGLGHPQPTIAAGTYEEQPLSQMRKVIAQRLQESKSFIPHFYVRQEIDAAFLMLIREQLQRGEIKISINDLIVRACALALRQHPKVNTGFNAANQSVILFKTIDIAIAVSLENGLITPIVRHADFKSLRELSDEIRQLAQKARESKLAPYEYQGGSFTISNLGMYGVTDFQAIINPPQAAILAVSGIREAAVVKEGQIGVGKTLNLTLSVDHRVIDGVIAAEFLKTLKFYLENPVLLV